MSRSAESSSATGSRRQFLQSSGAVLAGATLATAPALGNFHVAGDEILKIGLIGCGGRGTGAATQALNADPHVRLISMGDAFPDHLQSSLKALRRDDAIREKVDVKDDHCFTGLDAYKQVLASDVDVVLLTTPPHFRPIHIKAAVEAGKHIFAEKPCCVDATGARSVFESCLEAKKRNRAVVTGLCYRYDPAKREIMKRIHDGAIGDIVALHTTYNTGFLWNRPRKPEWSDMEWQMRNWLYFTWLSGDHIVEQHVHSLDKMAWAMKNEYPVKAVGTGGRQVRTAPEFGNIFDHHAVVFEYANGVKLFSYCRQQDFCKKDVSDYVIGTKGVADIMNHSIKGEKPWKIRGEAPDVMYQKEHDALFASIRAGNPINDGDFMTKSALMGIMGRMATYTGQLVTWDGLMRSKEKLGPDHYEFGSMAVEPVAMPGRTKLV
ncbi:MAG TPA: Gfo/Idh/MocA family oxidoreductase [Gemmataceae bacterium]|jgi:predicted dehydrogenase|nr:Gfo/Idh/MocA family oxidoreductase [Gemmataceae bacterium]